MTTAMQALRAYLKENHDKKTLHELLHEIDNFYIPEEKSMLLDFYIQNVTPENTLYQQVMDFEALYKFYIDENKTGY